MLLDLANVCSLMCPYMCGLSETRVFGSCTSTATCLTTCYILEHLHPTDVHCGNRRAQNSLISSTVQCELLVVYVPWLSYVVKYRCSSTIPCKRFHKSFTIDELILWIYIHAVCLHFCVLVCSHGSMVMQCVWICVCACDRTIFEVKYCSNFMQDCLMA